MDINFLVSTFEQDFKDEDYEKKEQLRRQFVEKFPLESIKDMDLEDYALGRKAGNLCWWIEYNSVELGSIKGGSAHKHKIFYSSKLNQWVFPKEFSNETEAWLKLRKEFYTFLKNFETDGSFQVDQSSMLYSMNMVRAKLLYMYFPNKLLPIFSTEHLQKILEFFGCSKETVKNWDVIKCNMELKNILDSNEAFKGWNPFKFMWFVYLTVIHSSKIYKIAPGDNARFWQECFDNDFICLGWDEVGDMRNYADYDEFRHSFEQLYPDYDKGKVTQKSNEMWTFFNLNAGDIIVANRGTSHVEGVGEVNEKGYVYDETRNEYKHIVYVNWRKDFKPKEISPQNYWAFRTVYNISDKLYKDIIGEDNITVKKPAISTPPVIIDEKPEKEIFTEAEERFFLQIDKNLLRKGNIILYGPPGTGKTFLSSKYLRWKSQDTGRKTEKEMCTFHPSFNYEDFIEGYKPDKSKNGEMSFKLKNGIFKDLCLWAKNNQECDYYLIIDEINRGNVEKIFGEMITLIEGDKRGMTLTLSQSGESFSVPKNVYIIGTMNTTDRSIKMLDAALRRRFAFIECMPDYELISKPLDSLGLSPKDILMKINAKLRELEDREKQIGHAYFMKNGNQIDSIEELKEVYIYDIIPLISEYCFNNYSSMSEIIGEKFIDEDSEELKYELLYANDAYFTSEIINKFGGKND